MERLKYSLNVPEVYLIWLKPELEGLIVPNKFYGIADIGRSPISMTASDGEIARLVRQHSCGPDRASKQRSAGAGADPGLQRSACGAEMGRGPGAMLNDRFTRRHAFARWDRVLATITSATEVARCVSP